MKENPFARLWELQSAIKQNISLQQSAKKAAIVAILIQEPKQESRVVLIKRNAYDGHHSAQMAFPGGKQDETDINLRHTAIREVEEEIGIQLADEDLIELEPHWVHVSNYWIQPYYIVLNKNLEYRMNKREINRIFEIPVAFLKHPDSLDYHELQFMQEQIIAPRFYYESEEIWGATAIMLYQLIQLLD
jgi:8-oxo-dGTP pyrophosphatase MutT (NUDIX family)